MDHCLFSHVKGSLQNDFKMTKNQLLFISSWYWMNEDVLSLQWAPHKYKHRMWKQCPSDSSRVSMKHFEEYWIPNFTQMAKSEKKKCPSIRKKNRLSARLRWFLSFGNRCESKCLTDSDAANVQPTWLISCFRCLHHNRCISSLSLDVS